MRRILFVCTGNTCRSPMAEALLKEKGDFEVKSAGVFAAPGNPAADQSIEVLSEKNIELSHQSSPLTDELISWADLILTMTDNHKQAVIQSKLQAADKTYTLIEFVDGPDIQKDISDPFGGSVEVYRKTLQQLEQYIDRLAEKLRRGDYIE